MKRHNLSSLAVLAALCGTGCCAWAQTATASDAGAPVTVPVVVLNHKNAPLDGLEKQDFILKVQGKTQTLTSAAHDVSTPVTYGLLFDVGRGQRSSLEDERTAARSLFPLLKPGDKVFVVQFARQIELLNDPTSDREKFEMALNEVGTSSKSFDPDAGNTGGVDSQGRQIRTGNTSLYDALFLSSDEILAKQPGKRVLIVFSDGIDVGSKESMGDARESIQRNGVLVYTIYSRGSNWADRERNGNNRGNGNSRGGWPGSYPGGGYPGGGGGYPGGGGIPGVGYPGGGYPGSYPGGNNPNGNNPNNPQRPGGEPSHKPGVDGREVLGRLSNDTGGRSFSLGNRGSLENDFADITADMKAAYWLTFTPEGAAARPGYHQFDLLVRGPDKHEHVSVLTSDGYYGGS